VQYKSTSFEVELTRDLESNIRRLVGELRRARRAASVHRNHASPARCRSCPVNNHCDERLIQ
jgi:CRISPR/Cas system-associated exonuclease Cas4 (RecB family)